MRTYEAAYTCVSVSAAQTLIYITNTSTMALRVVYASAGISDVDTNEQTYACLQKVSSLGTPTGTTVTPAKLSNGDPASSVTCKADITASEPTYSANTQIGLESFPMIAGFRFAPQRETDYLEISPSETWGLRLLGAITSATVPVLIKFQEIGG